MAPSEFSMICLIKNLFEVLNNDVEDVQGYVKNMKEKKTNICPGKQGKEVVKTSS